MARWQTFAALAHREFRLLWAGQTAGALAGWMDMVTRGWLMYELTHSPVQLGLVQGIQALPILLLSPVAGSVADRHARKPLVVAAQALAATLFGCLAALVLTGNVRPGHLYAMAFAMAVIQTFHQPARAAMVADAVPPQHLTNAIGLSSIGYNVARSTGPAIAGLLIARFGTGSCYVVQSAFYVLAVFATLGLRPAPPAAASAAAEAAVPASLRRSTVEGWVFSWRNEAVRSGLLVTAAASLFIMPFTTLLPVFARDILGVGATGQGSLLTAMGLGAICSAFLIASLGHQMPRGLLMLGGVTLYGLSVIAFAASPSFHLSLALMALVGMCHVSSYALVNTVIQSYSPAAFRGRTMAVFHMSEVVVTIGGMLAGALAGLVGARWAAGVMGASGALLALVIAAALPQARRIR